jgi:tetratricopeptide (TPR) repeat protein
MKTSLSITKPNDAWILHREEIDTVRDGSCNVYALLDACSAFCFGQEISVDMPSSSKILDLLKKAHSKAGRWPDRILILKKDSYVEVMQSICAGLAVRLSELPAKDLAPFVRPFKDAFRQFKRGNTVSDEPPLTEEDREELEAFIPDTYGSCPCGSGKKFKFCCQKIFKDITFAMCAAQEGRLNEALRHMKEAEAKVGRTSEVVCRYAICWSFFDQKKSAELLQEAFEVDPRHPRLNYILGIESVAAEKYHEAIKFYETAIENYPKDDKFHLNETYNNLGTAYFELKKYKEAKDVWEKALVLLPSDRMVKQNLFEFIYQNPDVPKDLREVSPFIEKYLTRRSEQR